jgi:cytochrome b561
MASDHATDNRATDNRATDNRKDEPAPPEGRSERAAPGERGKPVPPPGRTGASDLAEDSGTDRFEDPIEGYVPAQRRLHWIVAALVLLQLSVGVWIGGTSREPANAELLGRLFAIHGGTGVLIFVLMIIRLQLRRQLGAPPAPPGTPEDVARLARLNHQAFYVLLLTLPVLGWFALGAAGFGLSLFGIVTLPSPIAENHATALVLGRIHGGLALVLAAAILAHLAGVVYHTFIRRDGLLKRMAL